MAVIWFYLSNIDRLDIFFDAVSLSSALGIIFVFIIVSVSGFREGANKQVISSQADSLIKISRIWADFFPANTSN